MRLEGPLLRNAIVSAKTSVELTCQPTDRRLVPKVGVTQPACRHSTEMRAVFQYDHRPTQSRRLDRRGDSPGSPAVNADIDLERFLYGLSTMGLIVVRDTWPHV